jgi:hypothetical protein
MHIDHVIPVALGGDNRMSNLVTACAECNLGKHTQVGHMPRMADPRPVVIGLLIVMLIYGHTFIPEQTSLMVSFRNFVNVMMMIILGHWVGSRKEIR